MKNHFLFQKRLLFFLSLFLMFSPPVSAEPYLKGYSNSGCLNTSSYPEAYLGCDDEGITAWVEGSSIFVVHSDATYNCRPDDIAVSLSVRENRLILREKEVLTTPCDCLCCYDVVTEIAGIESRRYTIIVCWEDYETSKKQCHSVRVLVP